MELYLAFFLDRCGAAQTASREAWLEPKGGCAGQSMKALLKYAVVLALGLLVGVCIHVRPSLEQISSSKGWMTFTSIVKKAVSPVMPEAADARIDSAGAALVDEELDYRIAQRAASLDGWRTFLDAHGNGVYAQSARAEVEKLLAAPAAAPVVADGPNGITPPAAEGSNAGSREAKPVRDGMGSAAPSAGLEAANLTLDGICKRDGDRLERLRSSPSPEKAARFEKELGCDKLRPQLLALMASLRSASPAPVAAKVSNEAAPEAKSRGPKRPASGPSETRWTASIHPIEPSRQAHGCASRSTCFRTKWSLPPILLALLGERPPRSSAFRRNLTYPRPNDLHGR